MGENDYAKEAIRVVEIQIKKDGVIFNSKASHSFSFVTYRPELDCTQHCNHIYANYYQNLIGVLRWIVELGWMDILFEVACISRFTSNSRARHMQQVLNIFNYLKNHATSKINFGHNKINVQWDNFFGMNPIKELKSLRINILMQKNLYLQMHLYHVVNQCTLFFWSM